MKKEIVTIVVIQEIEGGGQKTEVDIKGKLTRFGKHALIQQLLEGERILDVRLY